MFFFLLFFLFKFGTQLHVFKCSTVYEDLKKTAPTCSRASVSIVPAYLCCKCTFAMHVSRVLDVCLNALKLKNQHRQQTTMAVTVSVFTPTCLCSWRLTDLICLILYSAFSY